MVDAVVGLRSSARCLVDVFRFHIHVLLLLVTFLIIMRINLMMLSLSMEGKHGLLAALMASQFVFVVWIKRHGLRWLNHWSGDFVIL